MTPRRLTIAFALLTITARSHAQQPTLDSILHRLDANLDHYDTRVPSFFCDEHVVSQVIVDHGIRETVADSTFRLKRVQDPDGTASLVESRDIKTVNGKPTNKQSLDGPSVLSGVFEGGLAIISARQTACMKYTLHPAGRKDPPGSVVVHFQTALTPQNASACLLTETSKGSATIDAASMQITHLAITTPHHTILPGTAWEAAIIGKRELAVDYAPVLLDGEKLWLPSAIAATSTSASGFHSTIWSFNAAYSRYHKLEVTSTIHSTEDGIPPPRAH